MENLLLHCAIIGAYCLVLALCVTLARRTRRRRPQAAVVAMLLCMSVLLVSCSSESGDHTGENWALAILAILAWLKGGR